MARPPAILGAFCGLLLAGAPGANLYLSWAVSCLLAATLGLALYRGLYVYMRERARTPLVMLVATLGVLLALTAFTTIVFHSAPRPLPDVFGSDPWTIADANIKGFNVFTIGVAIAGFVGLLLVLKHTAFGKAVRAIGDDEEVAKVVGINTTAVIAVVFFIAALYAAFAGVLSGHDTAIQPRMGLLLLLKGWIASVVGGIGNLYGALVGGFVLGLIEQFGIWWIWPANGATPSPSSCSSSSCRSGRAACCPGGNRWRGANDARPGLAASDATRAPSRRAAARRPR